MQIDEGGEPRIYKLKKRPAVHGLMTAVFSMFSGDDQSMANHFNIYFTGTEEEWTIGLTPRKRIMEKMIKFIILNGNSSIKNIKIVEQGDDVSDIMFYNQALHTPELSEEESALFEF
jgi:hypothetical protein